MRKAVDLARTFASYCRAIQQVTWGESCLASDRASPGSTPVSRLGESVSLSQASRKIRVGETPKPTPGTGVLPEECAAGSHYRFIFGMVFTIRDL